MKSLIVIALLAAACGKEIGDSCIISTDCDPNGMRECDTSQKEGYCTITGCDFDTCPSEATCVRFFMGTFENRTCNPATEDLVDSDGTLAANATDDCSLDELCALNGHCVARSTEVRYCMRTCKSNSDCRDGYECRSFGDGSDPYKDGGEPVLAPGIKIDSTSPGFCAAAPQ